MTNILYQHGTLGTLMAGLLQGTTSVNDMLQHGDLGIGTLTGSNGEVIYLDGKAYHADEYKNFVELTGDELTPYSTITNFKADTTFEVEQISSEQAYTMIKDKMLSKNLFSAVKISGNFKYMHVRMMPGQEEPYKRLVNAARVQTEIEAHDINGTIVGFYTPELFHGVGSAGFHIHFADDDREIGGHVLDFDITNATIDIQNFETFEQHFPVDNDTFLNTEIDYQNIDAEIREAE